MDVQVVDTGQHAGKLDDVTGQRSDSTTDHWLALLGLEPFAAAELRNLHCSGCRLAVRLTDLIVVRLLTSNWDQHHGQ